MTSDALYTVKGPKTLFEMTWPEVEAALEETDIVVVPVGSVEQHGRHLPLGSDTIQGDDMARRLVAKLGAEGVRVVAAPSIPFGVSEAHMKFPGSIALSSGTLMAVIREVCESLYSHGFRKFCLLLSHGENFPTLNLVIRDLAPEFEGSRFIAPNWLPIMEAHYPEVLKSERPHDEHHSGEGETSRMLSSTPNLVDLEKVAVYYPEPQFDPYAKRPYAGSVAWAKNGWGMKTVTPYGSMGNPLIATAETGDKLYEIIVDWLAQVIKAEFL